MTPTVPAMPRQLSLAVGLSDGATFENYYSGRNTEAIKRVEYAIRPRSGDRCLYLWGDPGVGKTHLLQAACHRAASAQRRIVYVPLRAQDLTHEALEGLDAIDLICIDDVQEIAKRPYWEAALFNVYERVVARKSTLLVTGNAPPARLTLSMRDLASRLGAGLVYQLLVLDDSEKLHALQQRARHRGFVLGDDVGRYVLERYPRDTAALFGLLDRIDHESLVHQRRVTIPFLRSLEAEEHS
ncbi:MAG: DnaA regulatory inactivator Hda [Gammaproteobacteria bacterium]|nr:DnaA regulatory inactivator Hda [Gammaproteobacteria bacterium]MDH3466549.1 DnaA regulatory inactivator Hda [Gammaproteobacteria bacterium]